MRAAASFIPGDEADSKVTDYNTAAAFIKKNKKNKNKNKPRLYY